MDNRNIFIYWTGKDYKLITILRNLIYLHSTNGKGYNVNFITDKNIHEYVDSIPDYFHKLCPAHQADFIRVNVICDYGGLWLDSDTIVLDTLDSLFDIIDRKNGFFIKENNNILWNGIFGSKKQTPLMIEWKMQLTQMLDAKRGIINWSDIGSNMLQHMYHSNSSLYDNYKIFNGLDNLYPVNWNKCVSEFIDKPYENYKTIIREYQPLVVLVNSVYKKLENMTEQEILEGHMPLNYFINKSLNSRNITINALIFENIYIKQLWNNGDKNIPLSGPGSSLKNTNLTSQMLNNFIYNNNCNSIVDLGCGDLNWISKTPFFNDGDIKYTGIDVVESLITSHLKTYPEKIFLCKDIATYKEIDGADIIILRDVIFLLKNEEILSIFDNIKCKFKFLLITSCRNHVNTDNFNRWRFSEKNIHIDPFNKPHKVQTEVYENAFNRDVYIYDHDTFYNCITE